MSEKPLHVKVAEALGCKPHDDDGYEPPHWYCTCERLDHVGDDDIPQVLRYDTDWSATGPLIEKYGLKIEPRSDQWDCWDAWANETAHCGDHGHGPTPLIAVCKLLLALKDAGKLG